MKIADKLRNLIADVKTIITVNPVENTTYDHNFIRSKLFILSEKKHSSTEEMFQKIANTVIAFLHLIGTFFSTKNRDFASIMFFLSLEKRLFMIQSDEFLAWLSELIGINRASRKFTFIKKAIENEGLSKRSKEIEPSYYWEKKGNCFYLSNGRNKIVKISANKVEIVDNGTDNILFLPSACLLPWDLVDPVDPFSTCRIFWDMSTVDPHGIILFKCWLLSVITNPNNKPIMVLIGPIGSGKTCILRNVFDLFGLPHRISCPKERDGEDPFWVLLNSGGIALLDNLDSKSNWFADNAASASTGGTHDKRKLYTDNENISLRARAWIAVTTANGQFAIDAGITDRSLVTRVSRRPSETSDSSLTEEVLSNRNSALSWICNILSHALADTDSVPKGLNKRHPDFAEFAVRIGRALGEEKNMIEALKAAEKDKGVFCLQHDPLGSVILDIHNSDGFKGTALKLINKLREIGFFTFSDPRKLGAQLNKLWPHISEATGATKDRDRIGTNVYTIPSALKEVNKSSVRTCKIPKKK